MPPLADDNPIARTANGTTATRPAPEAPPPRVGAVDFVWGAVATVLAVVYTFVLAPCAALVSIVGYPHLATPISRLWGWLITRTSGVKVEIEGLEHLRRPAHLRMVSNHQSFFDVFAICAFMPGEPRFVAKQELGKIPILGLAMRRSGHIMIDRARGGQAIRKAQNRARGIFDRGFRRGHAVQRQPGASVQRRRRLARDRDAAKVCTDGDQRDSEFLSTRRADRTAGTENAHVDRGADRYRDCGGRPRSADASTRRERARALSHGGLGGRRFGGLKKGGQRAESTIDMGDPGFVTERLSRGGRHRGRRGLKIGGSGWITPTGTCRTKICSR